MSKRSSGFTLIEVLISSLIISAFAFSFVYMLGSGIKSVVDSRQRTKQALTAASVMEELRSKPYSDIYSYNGSSFDNGRGTISVLPSGNDLAIIAVNNGIELVTLRSRFK